MDEIIEILNDAGDVTHTDYRSRVMHNGFVNFKLVSAFIRNHNGDFIMLRRAYHKSRYGGKFGTVGGCVGAEESYQEALFRELFEETGIDVATSQWKLLGHTTPTANNTIGHTAVYEIITSEPIQYTADDFAELRVCTLEGLTQLCDENTDVTHNLPIYMKKFY